MASPPRRPRTLSDAKTEAEAAFKSVTAKVAEAPPRQAAIPGPGWQDRINAALRKAAGKSE
jgi:hypothetical protein